MLLRYPLFSRLVLMLACLASLCAALYFSAVVSSRLEQHALAGDRNAAASLAGLRLIEGSLMLLYGLGCVFILRQAWKGLAVRTELALGAVSAHTAGAISGGDGGQDEIDRLSRALDSVSAQLACRLADGERLARQAREQERFAARSLEFIYRACTGLTESNASDEALRALLQDMTDCLQAHSCALALLEPVAEGLGVAACNSAPRLPPLLDEFDPEFLARGEGLRRTRSTPGGDVVDLAVPVRDGDDTYGVLVVEAPGDFLFESRHRSLVDAVASLFALALGNLQRNQRRRRLALMDERNAIAGELHDSLAQALSFMKLQIARLQLEIGRSCMGCSPADSVQSISGDIKTGLDSAYRHLRELLSAFRTSMPPGGLQQALREIVEELSARAATGISLDYRLGSLPLTVNEEFHIHQVVREALSNVVRHARAAHAMIRIGQTDSGELLVEIEDDGRGLRADTGGEGHHGLSIMRERAGQLGGTLALQAGPAGGTCVTLRFRPRALPRGSSH